MNRTPNMLKGSMFKTMLQLMWPILICGFFQQLYNMADSMVVGQFVGSDGLAIVGGSCNILIGAFNGIVNNFAMGAMLVVAFFYGAEDRDKTETSIKMSLVLAAIIGLLATIFFWVFASNILEIMEVPTNLFQGSVAYLRLYTLGFVPGFIFQMIVNLLRAMGETKRPSMYLIMSFILNIILDILFVGVFKMQQAGVAYAYILSMSISAIFTLYSISLQFDFHFQKLHLERNIVGQILKVGIPSAFTSLLYAFSNMFIQTSINKLGSETIAALSIESKIENIFWIAMTGLAVSITALAGQNYGAKNNKRVRATAGVGILVGYGMTAIIAIAYIFFGKTLSSLFSNDPQVIEMAFKMLLFMVPAYFFYPLLEVFADTLKCLGQAFGTTILTVITIVVVRVAWITFYALPNLSYEAILWCYPISWIISSLAFTIYYLIIRKRKLQVA